MKSRSILFFLLAVLVLACGARAYAQSQTQDRPLQKWMESRRGQQNGGFDMDRLESWGSTSCIDKAAKLEKHKKLLERLSKDRPVPALTAAYGRHTAQQIDVYIPDSTKAAGPYPVILMVHGGGWCIGDKAMGKVVTNKVARWLPKGFIVVSANYRMIPDGADPALQARDVADAIGYIQQNAGKWNGNPRKIIAMGHSAGAHLVALVGADIRAGLQPWLGTISLDSGTLDVADTMREKHFGLYDEAFGKDEAYWKSVSPIHRLSAASLPFLGVCSARRKEACPQAQAYARASKAAGVRAAVLELDLGHGAINANLGAPGAYTDAVESFMASLDGDVAKRLR